MYNHGELRDHKYSEIDFANTLYRVYEYYGFAAPLPYDITNSNCSLPIVNHYDEDTTTKFKYSCLPKSFINKKLLGFKEDDIDKKVAIELLYKKIGSYKLTELLKWMTTNGYNKNNIKFAKACFKSYKDPVEMEQLPDFSCITKKDIQYNNRMYWVSNQSIKEFILPLCKMNDVRCIGTIYLNFLNNIRPEKRIRAFENSLIRKEVVNMYNTTKNKYYIGYISIFNHWSTIFIDKVKKVAYHYNSQGYIPTTQIQPPFKLYSYDRVLRPHEYIDKNKASKEQYIILYFLQYLCTELGLNRLYLNLEQSQRLDGECGIFSLFFSQLIINNINNENIVPLVYNVFKFMGDKRMREFRDVLYTNKDTFKTEKLSHNIEKYNQTTITKLNEIIKRITG